MRRKTTRVQDRTVRGMADLFLDDILSRLSLRRRGHLPSRVGPRRQTRQRIGSIRERRRCGDNALLRLDDN